ncbi:MAG TPA: hypothetical protein VGI72_03350 [Gaiellales bacterium]
MSATQTWAPQVAVTVIAEVREGRERALEGLLHSMGDGVSNERVIAFGDLEGVHFARLVLAPPVDPRDASTLILMSDVDGAQDDHLAELAERQGDGIDAVFSHCSGYPDAPAGVPARLAFLRERAVRADTSYVNRPGRTVAQVRDEARLRDAIEIYLDSARPQLETCSALDARAQVQAFVAGDPRLAFAATPAPEPRLGERVRSALDLARLPATLIVLAPLLVVVAGPWIVLLRLHECHDPAPDIRPDPAAVALVAGLEDHLAQNSFTAVGRLKPGPFRRLTSTALLWVADWATPHLFAHADLAGVKTIHFARWVFLDGKSRLVFASNYDGSLETYMGDFIDKVAWGLNAIFSNGVGYPRTNWLFCDGAWNEEAFKHYIHTHQLPAHVWYSAYGNLTNANIEQNAQIRAGLHGRMTATQAERWLELL